MPYLVAAVALLTGLTLVNLTLLLAVLRRLRHQAAARASVRDPMPKPVLDIGETPADFATVTVEGERVGPDTIAGGLVGFFSPHCSVCHERLPQFVAYARGLDRSRVVAVLVGTAEETGELAAALGGVAGLVVEAVEGPLYRAFAVAGLPVMCLLDQRGTVVASGTDLGTFPQPVRQAVR
jgi:hypothetical protein